MIRFQDAGPDSMGRRHFVLTWTDAIDDQPRGQHFFARPEKYGHTSN